MIDINTIINSAIQQEVSKAITSYIDAYFANVQQEHQQQLAALKEEIEQLKQQRADSPATGEVNAAFIREIAMDAAEQVMAEHLEGYDHDEYDSTVTTVEDFPDLADLVTKEDLLDARVSFSI